MNRTSVTHKLALAAADVLALYCKEHSGLTIRDCTECCFQLERDYKNYCYLMVYLGYSGEELKARIQNEIIKRNEELSEREEKNDEQT